MVAAIFAAVVCSQSHSPVKGDHIGPFAMPALEGPVLEWRPGRVTVLCAFAYWCDTWKTQSDRLLSLQGTFKGQQVDFLAISVDGLWTDVDRRRPWSERLVDVGGKWSEQHGIDRIPYTLVLDRTGTVVWTGFGISRSDDVKLAIDSALSPGSTYQEKVLYLTFDDFPAEEGNDELLDALRLADVTATFFVVGESGAKRTDALRRAVRDGHGLQVHAWKHSLTGSEPERCKDWMKQEPSS